MPAQKYVKDARLNCNAIQPISRTLRVCPGSFCCVRELSEHQANGSQVQEGESLAAAALPVLGQPTAAVQPSYGAFDDPALRQDREALGLIGPLDDLHPDAAADASQTLLELRPLIAAVGVKLEQKRVQPEEGGHDHHATVTVLHIGCLHEGVHQQALCVDQDMALLPPDLLARVVARRVDGGPPFSAPLTLWLSMMAAVGLASRPACSRHWTKSA